MTESGDEEETEGIVNQVLDEIGIEVSGKVREKASMESFIVCKEHFTNSISRTNHNFRTK